MYSVSYTVTIKDFFNKKMINRPAILTQVFAKSQNTFVMCEQGQNGTIMFAAVFKFSIFIAWEPFLETDIFVCASFTRQYQHFLITDIIPRS